MNGGVLSVLRAKFDAVSPKKPKISIFEGFFRKTRKISDGVLSVLRVKFDAVLRKKTQKSSFDQSDNIVIRNNYHKKHK